MTLAFDLNSVRSTEFGVGHEGVGQSAYLYVPVEPGVQNALKEMVAATLAAMFASASEPATYEPSEKYASQEYVAVGLDDVLASDLRMLHDAANLPINAQALATPANVFAYFARFTDASGRRLTALRRATQFKGVLKKRLLQIVNDALHLVEDHVFKLDNDFDVLVDAERIHILRPSGFEFAAHLQEAILSAVPANVAEIRQSMSFVDFDSIEAYATKHPRAARYLASIRSQGESANIDKTALKRCCKQTGVTITVKDGRIVVPADEVLGFLEVLDRRRYRIDLVPGSPETYRAASRSKLAARGRNES